MHNNQRKKNSPFFAKNPLLNLALKSYRHQEREVYLALFHKRCNRLSSKLALYFKLVLASIQLASQTTIKIIVKVARNHSRAE